MPGIENRRARAARLWAALGDASRCPLCGGAFGVRELALVCPRGHAYDLSAAGTVHLLRGRGASPVYTRALFLARRRIIMAGLFQGIVAACAEALADAGAPAGLLLDAGCGDGLLGFTLARALGRPYMGVDASAEAIRVAGRDVGGEGLLIVGDLAHLPLRDATVAVILNLLSPARYAEFRRVLAPGGLLVKVIRGPRHLWELREEVWAGARGERGAGGAGDVGDAESAHGAHGVESAGECNAREQVFGEPIAGVKDTDQLHGNQNGATQGHDDCKGGPSPAPSGEDERDALRLFRESCDVLSLREIEYAFPVPDALWEDLVAMTPMTTHYRRRILSKGRSPADMRVTVHVTLGVGRFV